MLCAVNPGRGLDCLRKTTRPCTTRILSPNLLCILRVSHRGVLHARCLQTGFSSGGFMSDVEAGQGPQSQKPTIPRCARCMGSWSWVPSNSGTQGRSLCHVKDGSLSHPGRVVDVASPLFQDLFALVAGTSSSRTRSCCNPLGGVVQQA